MLAIGLMMMISTSVSRDMAAPNRLAFTMARLKSTANLTNLSSQPPIEVQIDGLPGYEIVSQANHRSSGQRAVLYQVILFEPTHYYLMQGIAAEKEMGEYVPAFRSVATSFKRKNVTPTVTPHEALQRGYPR